MDERFRAAYETVFDLYQTSAEAPLEQGGTGGPPVGATLRSLINQVDAEFGRTGRHLRPDGKYFLLTNFYSMVYLPLILASGGRINIDELLAIINADIRDIVEDAADQQLQGEISGHVLLDSVARRWRFLRTTRLRLWGDK